MGTNSKEPIKIIIKEQSGQINNTQNQEELEQSFDSHQKHARTDAYLLVYFPNLHVFGAASKDEIEISNFIIHAKLRHFDCMLMNVIRYFTLLINRNISLILDL